MGEKNPRPQLIAQLTMFARRQSKSNLIANEPLNLKSTTAATCSNIPRGQKMSCIPQTNWSMRVSETWYLMEYELRIILFFHENIFGLSLMDDARPLDSNRYAE